MTAAVLETAEAMPSGAFQAAQQHAPLAFMAAQLYGVSTRTTMARNQHIYSSCLGTGSHSSGLPRHSQQILPAVTHGSRSMHTVQHF